MSNEQTIDAVKIGGEEREREILPVADDEGRPVYYKVKITGYRQKQGKPNDRGEDTFYYSWTFKILDGEHKDKVVYGSTNSEARRAYTTKKPLKLLQLIMAVNGGKEPDKGKVISLSKLVGQTLLVELENKEGADGPFQIVSRYYAAKKGAPAPIDEAPEEVPTVNIDEEMPTPEQEPAGLDF